MDVVRILLIFLEVVCGLLLIGLILLQKSKGQGLGLAFGAEMGESLFGARATNVLVKGTIWLATIFLVNSLILAKLYTATAGGVQSSALRIIDTVPASEQPAASGPSMPGPAGSDIQPASPAMPSSGGAAIPTIPASEAAPVAPAPATPAESSAPAPAGP